MSFSDHHCGSPEPFFTPASPNGTLRRRRVGTPNLTDDLAKRFSVKVYPAFSGASKPGPNPIDDLTTSCAKLSLNDPPKPVPVVKPIRPSLKDIVDFMQAVKHLVHVQNGSIEIPDEQMALIRASVFTFTDMAFEINPNLARATQFCEKKLPDLLCNIQFINRSVQTPLAHGPATPPPSPIDTDTANLSISTSLTRAVQILQTNSPQIGVGVPVIARFMDKIEFYWMRQRLVSVLVFTLGCRFDVAGKELRDLVHQTVLMDKRDSAQTLVNVAGSIAGMQESWGDAKQRGVVEHDVKQRKFGVSGSVVEAAVSKVESRSRVCTGEDEPQDVDAPTTYLIYTGPKDAFLPVQNHKPSHLAHPSPPPAFEHNKLGSLLSRRRPPVSVTSKILKSAIARMPASALVPGDLFVILSGWHSADPEANGAASLSLQKGHSVTVSPKTECLPAPPLIESDFNKFARPDYGVGIQSRSARESGKAFQGFESVALARLESADHLVAGYSRLTVEVLKEREAVPFRFGGVEGGMDKVEVENRVKDALRFGAVRIEKEVADGLF
ncbi:hypothetical protein HDU98_010336 [Podochytrium sp. JEL0797]|nr:hypothetical protein HDU98_010336 [Podochytrium sp. JEL0797]